MLKFVSVLFFITVANIVLWKIAHLTYFMSPDMEQLTMLISAAGVGLQIVLISIAFDSIYKIVAPKFDKKVIMAILETIYEMHNEQPQLKTVKIQLLHPNAMPKRATPDSNGYDCFLNINHFKNSLDDKKAAYNRNYTIKNIKDKDYIVLGKNGKIIIPLGFKMCLPSYLSSDVLNKSGIGLKTEIIIPNAPGLIDTDFRGEACVILVNLGDEDILIEDGKAVCQITFTMRPSVTFEEGEVIADTQRGENGHGHSGSAMVQDTLVAN